MRHGVSSTGIEYSGATPERAGHDGKKMAMILMLKHAFAFAAAMLVTVAATAQPQRARDRSPAGVLRRVEELISGVHCGNDVLKHTRTDAVAVLVASGRDLLPTLTEKVAAGSEAPVFIAAIGFLANENDREAVTALAHAAFTPSTPGRSIGAEAAVDALLRIGGTATLPVQEFRVCVSSRASGIAERGADLTRRVDGYGFRYPQVFIRGQVGARPAYLVGTTVSYGRATSSDVPPFSRGFR